MAINDSINTQETQAQQEAKPEAQQERARERERSREQRQQRRPKSSGNLLHALTAASTGYVSQSDGGSYFLKFREFLNVKLSELLNDKLAFKIYSFPRDEHGMRFSMLTVAIHFKEDPKIVAFHTLVLEATGPKIEPKVMPMGDLGQVSVRRSSSDAVNEQMERTVNSVLQATHHTDVALLPAGYMVVPSTVVAEENDRLMVIAKSSANAGVNRILQETANYEPIDLSTLPEDFNLKIQIISGVPSVEDIMGNPVRSSAILDLSLSPIKNRDSRSLSDDIHSEGGEMPFSRMTGFINPIWAYDQQSQRMSRREAQERAKLAAEFVVTSVSTPHATTPSAVLLGIMSSHALSDDDAWRQLCVPSGMRFDKTTKHDVRYLNIVADVANENIGSCFGQVAPAPDLGQGGLREFSTYLDLLFTKGMTVSIDCEEHGPNAWYTDLYLAAYNGDPDAERIILDSANELTAGEFAPIWEDLARAEQNIFAHATRIPLGYYMDPVSKVYRDIRDLDLTEVCRAYENNPEQILEWISATTASSYGNNGLYNFVRMERFISHILADQVEFTGTAHRLTISSSLRECFDLALNEIGINTDVISPMSMDRVSRGLRAPDYLGSALLSATNSFRSSVRASSNSTRGRLGSRFARL